MERDIDRAAGFVTQQGVALAERAPLHVLAGQADGRAVGQNGGESQCLGRRPIDRGRVRVGEDVTAALQDAQQLAIDLEALRQRQQGVIQSYQLVGRVSRLGAPRRAARRGW